MRPSASSARFNVAPGDQRFLVIRTITDASGQAGRETIVLVTDVQSVSKARLVVTIISPYVPFMPSTITTAEAGRLGGLQSRRHLSAESARAMVCVREARKLFRANYITRFWWARPDLVIHAEHVAWVADGLRKHGGRAAWRAAARLERMLTPPSA